MTIWYIKILCIFFILILMIGALVFVRFYRHRNSLMIEQSQKATSFNDIFASRGFFYSFKDDALYSTRNAPQSQFGCCQLYDDTMPLLGMIVDCEPIYFDYDNAHWLIEFYKGQYGMATGCQIGTFSTLNESIKAPGFQGMFYENPDNKECCCISYSLKRKNKLLLRNTTSECFSTGFRLGEFSNPATLALKVKITFPNKKMQHAFIGGLKMAGYHKSEYASLYKTVTVHFTKPHTTQPASRTGIQEAIIQQGNRASCQKYSQLTSKHTNALDKLELCSRVDSDLYNKVLKSLYSKELYSNYELISPILKKLAAMNDYEVLNSSSL